MENSSKSGRKDARSGSYTTPNRTSRQEAFNKLTVMTNRVNKFTANPFSATGQNKEKSEIGEDRDELGPVVSELPVEYDGFEQLAKKYVIKVQAKKVMRYPEIKSRTTTPKKEPGTIKEEPMAPRKQKKSDVTEEERKSPYEEPFATKLKNEDDTESSDSDTQEEDPDSWTVIVYKGVVNKGKSPVEDRRFVMFSDSPRMYIRVEELEARLLGDYEARYDNDWKLEHRGRKPFTVWKMNGIHKRIAVPSLTFKKSVAEQYAYWNEVAKTASRTKANYDPASRYWDLSGPFPIKCPDIKLRFEASDKVSREELEVMVSMAVDCCWCRPNWEIVEFGDGEKPSEDEKDPWVLVDKHLLSLYALYASPKTIKILKNQNLRLWMGDQPFPKGGQAAKANKELFPEEEEEVIPEVNPKSPHSSAPHGDQGAKADKVLSPEVDPKPPRAHAKETGASMSSFKLRAAWGQRAMVPTQAAVMNNKSATLLAQMFGWPANASDGTWKNQAEWLHRVAFSYGGLGESANHLSSQTPNNLIFGTKEANTLMMRAEATVKHLVWLEDQDIREWLPDARDNKITAIINTKFGYNHHEEGGKPFQQDYVDKDFKLNITERSSTIIKSALKRDPEAPNQANATRNTGGKIDEEEVKDTAWMKEKKYRWFAPRLVYEVSVSLSGRNYNTTLEIIPFARRIPMRLEYELDKLAEELVFGTRPDKEDAGNMPSRARSKSRQHGSLGTAGK